MDIGAPDAKDGAGNNAGWDDPVGLFLHIVRAVGSDDCHHHAEDAVCRPARDRGTHVIVSAAAKRIPQAAWPCTPHGSRRLGTEALEREDEEHGSKNVAHRQPFGIGDYLRGSRPINIKTLG